MSRARGAILALCSALLLPARAHAADAAPSCATAYAKGQDDRLAGRLFDARTAFKLCAESTCPEELASDCSRWAAEVEADLPTVLVHVVDARGQALPTVRVFADGQAVTASELSRPLVLEAGPHSLRFEADGYEATQVQTALRPTDRELEIRATLYKPGERARSVSHRQQPPSAGVPKLSLALAGVGLLALGTSAYFGIAAQNQYSELEQSCAPGCRQADADAVESQALVSDIALATSLVALGAAAWVFFGTPEAPRAALVVAPRRDGGAARVQLAF